MAEGYATQGSSYGPSQVSPPSPSKAPWKEIQETNVWIRKSQKARAYAFPHAFAPQGKLRSEEVHNYMDVMNQYYEYNSRDQDLILELKEDGIGGEQECVQKWKVGEVYSADFYWSEFETIRLHLIAVRPNHDRVTLHYHVFDMGSAGNAYSISMEAWDNWRQWAHDKSEGVHIDKRIVYMAIGDRSQIDNMTLEEFSKLTCDQVEALQDKLVPGMHLVRPSIEDAFMNHIPNDKTPPPVVDLLSSSSGSDSGKKGEKDRGFRGNELKARTKARRSRDPKHLGGRMKGGMQGGRGAKAPRKVLTFMDDAILRRPNGEPYPQSVIDKMTTLFTECVSGVSPPPSFPVLLSPTIDVSTLTLDESVSLDESIMSVPGSSFDGDTSNGASVKDSSMCDVSGVELLDDSVGPLPRQDSVEVFLAKMANNSQIFNVSTSTDESIQIDTPGQTSDGNELDV